MKRDEILNGFRIGQYGLNSDEVYDIIEKKYSDGINFVSICTYGGDKKTGKPFKQEEFIEWAKYLADRKMYFYFNGGGEYLEHAGFTEETAKKMKEIAGEYFLAYEMAELGSAYACKGSAYDPEFVGVYKDLQEAKDIYIERAKKCLSENAMSGLLDTSIIEPTAMVSYNCEAGMSFPTMEFWPGDVEISAAFVRGTAATYSEGKWGTYFAHELYAGLEYDEIKRKRFRMGYDYCYLSGGNYFMNENGDEAAGYRFEKRVGPEHPLCRNYQKVMAEFAKFAKEDFRPAGGPKVKVAFVRGNLDGYSFLRFGGTLWRAHTQPEYGYGAPEFAWRVLENLQCKRRWCDVHNFGDKDLSGAPAYGLYDVIPATAGADVFAKYDYLIFVGWNSMTQEIYDNLRTFVKQGGRLFMTAAHLNSSIKRDGKIELLNNGDVSDLFGCRLNAENPHYKDSGTKFHKSIVPEFLYPSLNFEWGDPYFAEGYINYANTTLTTGVATGRLSDTFFDKNEDVMPPSLVENKCGEGYAILMTNLEYPSGAGAPMYQNLVREIFTASHRYADVKVYGGDSLRFSVYEGDKVYLLNTDFDNKIAATIDYGTHRVEYILNPCEFKAVEKTKKQ